MQVASVTVFHSPKTWVCTGGSVGSGSVGSDSVGSGSEGSGSEGSGSEGSGSEGSGSVGSDSIGSDSVGSGAVVVFSTGVEVSSSIGTAVPFSMGAVVSALAPVVSPSPQAHRAKISIKTRDKYHIFFHILYLLPLLFLSL